MKFGISYSNYYGMKFENFISKILPYDFKAVQLIPDQDPNLYNNFSSNRIDKLLDLKYENELQYSIHNVFYDINLLSLVPDVKENSFKITKKVIEFAKRIEAKNLTLHLGYIFPGWQKDKYQNKNYWINAEEVVHRIIELSEKYEINILFENGSYHLCTKKGRKKIPFHIAISPAEINRIFQLSNDKINLCFDFNKALSTDHTMKSFLEIISHKVSEIQISDLKKENFIYLKEILSTNKNSLLIFENSIKKSVEMRNQILAFS